MPSISGTSGPEGPILLVGANQPRRPEEVIDAQDFRFHQALVDTGASVTCISRRIVDEIGLNPIGKTEVLGVAGVHVLNLYAVDVLFEMNQDALSVRETMTVCEFVPESASFQILLGRGVLCTGAFTLSYDHHFTLSL